MKQIICQLQNLICHHCDERDGDELFLKFNGSKIWPENKKFVSATDNCIIPINLKLPVKPLEKVTLQLWDYDLLSNDLLGEFNFVPDGEGQFTCDLKNPGSSEHKFTLQFSVYTIRKQSSLRQPRA
jgi:hypothetical protein